MNSSDNKEHRKQILLRKHRDTLYISGNGIMVFGVWSLIQLFLYFVMRQEEIKALADPSNGITVEMIYIMMSVFVFIDIVFRIIIGLSARAVSKGRKKSISYIILCMLIIIAYFVILVFTILNYSDYSPLSYVMNIIVTITSLFIHLQLVIAGLSVRKLTRSKV